MIVKLNVFLSLLTDVVESAMTEICESKEELKYLTAEI